MQNQIEESRAQLAQLQEYVASALQNTAQPPPDSHEGEFQPVRHRRRKTRGTRDPPLYSEIAASSKASGKATPVPPPPAPVPSTAARRPKPSTISFGSSLARGSQDALGRHAVDVMEYNFPGATLPVLRSRIIPILEKNPQVTTVIIQGGGNDCELPSATLPEIKAEYDALIDAIKVQQGWECKVVISSIPQRRWIDTPTRLKIAGLNLEHYYHSDPDHYIYYVDAAPKVQSYFADRVHYNYHGMDFWARKVANFLFSNFTPVINPANM